jgi:hypothetical protein
MSSSGAGPRSLGPWVVLRLGVVAGAVAVLLDPEFPALTNLIFQVMQGMALGKAVFGGDEAQSLRPQVLALLKRVVGEAFAAPAAR